MMRKLLLASLLAVMPALTWAQEQPATEPAKPRQFGRFGPTSERETEEVMAFMREYAPNRWQAVQALPESGQVRRNVMGFIMARYRALQATKQDDPELYTIRLTALQVEDELYGTLAKAETQEAREKLRQQIRDSAKRLAELNIAERQHMVQRIRERLASEEGRLSNDVNQLDANVNARVDEMIAEGTSAIRRGFDRSRPEHRMGRRATTAPSAK